MITTNIGQTVKAARVRIYAWKAERLVRRAYRNVSTPREAKLAADYLHHTAKFPKAVRVVVGSVKTLIQDPGRWALPRTDPEVWRRLDVTGVVYNQLPPFPYALPVNDILSGLQIDEICLDRAIPARIRACIRSSLDIPPHFIAYRLDQTQSIRDALIQSLDDNLRLLLGLPDITVPDGFADILPERLSFTDEDKKWKDYLADEDKQLKDHLAEGGLR